MDIEKEITDIKNRLNYQEKIHKNIDESGNYIHKLTVDISIVIVSVVISVLVIKLTKI